MRVHELDNTTHQQVRTLVRSVDKKLHHQLADGPTGQDPYFILTLNIGTQQASMPVSIEEVHRGRDDDRERWKLRERIKQTRLRLWYLEKPAPIFNTKAIRPGSESFSHFRPFGRR